MIGGDEYLKVARSLLKSKDATDEEIASSTGLRINMVRKVLYDLLGKSLITGIRVKDERKKLEIMANHFGVDCKSKTDDELKKIIDSKIGQPQKETQSKK